MQINSLNPTLQKSQPKYCNKVNFKKTTPQIDTFEPQKESEKKWEIATIISGAAALALATVLVFKQKKIIDTKVHVDSLEKTKTELTEVG